MRLKLSEAGKAQIRLVLACHCHLWIAIADTDGDQCVYRHHCDSGTMSLSSINISCQEFWHPPFAGGFQPRRLSSYVLVPKVNSSIALLQVAVIESIEGSV